GRHRGRSAGTDPAAADLLLAGRRRVGGLRRRIRADLVQPGPALYRAHLLLHVCHSLPLDPRARGHSPSPGPRARRRAGHATSPAPRRARRASLSALRRAERRDHRHRRLLVALLRGADQSPAPPRVTGAMVRRRRHTNRSAWRVYGRAAPLTPRLSLTPCDVHFDLRHWSP